MFAIAMIASAFAGTATVSGTLRFYADYTDPDGQVPTAQSKYRYAYVCLYEKVGSSQDFDVYDEHFNDTLLGCTSSDNDGAYSLSFTSSETQRSVYLLHWFCDADDSGSTSDAEVCIRLNYPETSASSPENRKYIWSRLYTATFGSSSSTSLSWNLSCPNRSGFGSTEVTCSGDLEPQGSTGNTNSNYGYNWEFTHAFRSSVEPWKTHGTMKPDSGNTLSYLCSDNDCQDEINLAVCDAIKVSGSYLFSQCTTASCTGNNQSLGYDRVCLTTPDDPWRTVHEIGHNVHRRWMVHESSLANGLDCSGWDEDENQRCATSEGWANFFSSSCWYNDDETSPTYGTSDIEDPDTLNDCNTEPYSEGHASQFFWDLYDQQDHANESDSLDLNFSVIRAVWSLFPSGTSDRQNNEDWAASLPPLQFVAYAKGRNLLDYSYHYDAEYGITSAFEDIQTDNCLDEYEP